MPIKIYIPDAAFQAGGKFYGQSKARVVLTVGCANDTHQQVRQTGVPIKNRDVNHYELQIRNAPTTVPDHLWADWTIEGMKTQLYDLVLKGLIIVNDGTYDLTPDEILEEAGGASAAATAGGAGGGSMIYRSPQDFQTVYISGTTLTLSGLNYTPSVEQFQSIKQVKVDGEAVNYVPSDEFKFLYNSGTKVLTVTGAAFINTDLEYEVVIAGPDKAYNQGGNYNENAIVNYRADNPLHPIHADTTNLAGPANYPYPSAAGFVMTGYEDFSLQYKLTDLELRVYGRNADAFDWELITGMAYDSATKLYGADVIGAAAASVHGTLHFENLDLKEIYVDIESFDATNLLALDGRLTA